MLEVRDLEVAYGKIVAVKKISFSVDQGQVVSLIGTNGAGKTTTLRMLLGLVRPTAGSSSIGTNRIGALIEVRGGIATGPAVAGVIGERKFQ